MRGASMYLNSTPRRFPFRPTRRPRGWDVSEFVPPPMTIWDETTGHPDFRSNQTVYTLGDFTCRFFKFSNQENLTMKVPIKISTRFAVGSEMIELRKRII